MARRRTPTQGRFDRLRALLATRAGRALVRAGLGAVVLLATGLVVRQARAYAGGLAAYRVGPDRVHLLGLPEWLRPQVRERLFDPALLGAFSVSIYDVHAPDRVRDRILAHPLVEEVEEVVLRYPARAFVRVRLRTPLARVEVPGWRADGGAAGLYLAEDARLLHPVPYEPLVAERAAPLPRVVGIRAAAPRRLGEVWEDGSERVLEAIAAAQMARRLHADFQGRVWVEEIDVARFPAPARARERGEVRLVLSCPAPLGGGRVLRTVEWGRTERALGAVPGEDSYATKLSRLRTQLTLARIPPVLDVRYEVN